jgi:hypothetical protein
MYSSPLPLMWHYIVVGGQRHASDPQETDPDTPGTGGVVGYRDGQDRRGKSHHNVIRSPDRPAHSESFLYDRECSTCIYHCDFIGSSKYKNLRIMQMNGRVNYELKCYGHGQHFHNSVKSHFNEAIVLVTAWSGGRIPVGARFTHSSRPALGPAQPPIKWGPSSSRVEG